MCNLFDCCLPYFSFCHNISDSASEREPLLTQSAKHDVSVNSEPEWLQQCRKWAAIQPTTAADKQQVACRRQKALHKIIEFTEKQWITLDLSNLELDELPPTLPPNIITLICNNNALSALPEHIPQGILKIKAHHNNFSTIAELPPNLQYADFSHNRISQVNDFPAYLETIDLSHNLLTDMPCKVNDSLRSLNLSHNKLPHLPRHCLTWPRHLQVDVSANDFLFITRIGWKHEMKQPHYKGPDIRFEPPEITPLPPILHSRTRKLKTPS